MVLEVRDLSMSFGGLKVVDQLSFAVGRGERLALIGPNGAGKTTVFNLITGVYAPDGGAIVGGLLIGVVETFSITWFGARAVDIGVYGLLLAILFVRPTGLLGDVVRQQRM